jgi:hypothetical protein
MAPTLYAWKKNIGKNMKISRVGLISREIANP